MFTDSGPIFVRSDLPQPRGASGPHLQAIATTRASDAPVRRRQTTPARLAIEVEASKGSGLIDLDEVAQALLRQPSERRAVHGTHLVATSATSPFATVPPMSHVAPHPGPVAPTAARNALVLTVLLLGTLAAMLAWLAAH